MKGIKDRMIAVKRQTFRMAQSLGFKPKHRVSSSVNRKTLYLSEYDFERMNEVFKAHTIQNGRDELK